MLSLNSLAFMTISIQKLKKQKLIRQGGEMALAHVVLQNLKITPGQLAAMPQAEKAFIYASLSVAAEENKKIAERRHD